MSARGVCRGRPQRVSAEYTKILRAEIATVNGTVECRLIGAVFRRLTAHPVACIAPPVFLDTDEGRI